MSGYNALLLDIEGTTTSISFVKDVLFPFVRHEVSRYLRDNWGTPELVEVVNDFIVQNEEDIRIGLTEIRIVKPKNNGTHREATSGLSGGEEVDAGDQCDEDSIASILDNVRWQMDADRKTGPLKRLQGFIFRDAYVKGQLKGHVYDDVPPAFDFWTKSNKKIYIYSSGSVEAQKLLFRYSTHGNLCGFLSGHFDGQTAGPKVDSSSYVKISEEIKLPANDILFLTDIVKEAEAAREAGLQVRLAVRPGNGDLTAEAVDTFGTFHSFQELE